MSTVNRNQQQSTEAEWLVKAVERMLRPIIRLLVGRVSCNVLVDLIKQIFVEEAKRHLTLREPNKRVTKSALALLTGLDTRAIAALEDSTADFSIADMSPQAAVLAVWATDDMFKSPETGQPLDLPIYGRGLSFQNLVTRTVGRNVTCMTVLERLTESGNIEVVDKDYVRLKERFYIPINESERTFIEAGSLAVNRLVRTIDHNMNKSSSNLSNRWLQQDRWTRKLPINRVEEFREDVRKLLEKHIEEAESQIEPYENPVRTDDHATAGIGWYYWEDVPDQTH